MNISRAFGLDEVTTDSLFLLQYSLTIFNLPRRLQNVAEEKKMLCWRRPQDVFNTSSPRQVFAGNGVSTCGRQTETK